MPLSRPFTCSRLASHVLDGQAVEMIRQAARATEVPDTLKGRNFRMLMPIRFSLDEDR